MVRRRSRIPDRPGGDLGRRGREAGDRRGGTQLPLKNNHPGITDTTHRFAATSAGSRRRSTRHRSPSPPRFRDPLSDPVEPPALARPLLVRRRRAPDLSQLWHRPRPHVDRIGRLPGRARGPLGTMQVRSCSPPAATLRPGPARGRCPQTSTSSRGSTRQVLLAGRADLVVCHTGGSGTVLGNELIAGRCRSWWSPSSPTSSKTVTGSQARGAGAVVASTATDPTGRRAIRRLPMPAHWPSRSSRSSRHAAHRLAAAIWPPRIGAQPRGPGNCSIDWPLSADRGAAGSRERRTVRPRRSPRGSPGVGHRPVLSRLFLP